MDDTASHKTRHFLEYTHQKTRRIQDNRIGS